MLYVSPRRKLLGAALALGTVPLLRRRAQGANAVTLTIAGNGGAMGTMHLIADAFQQRNPEVEVQFLPNLGTSGGIAAALQGAAGIAVAARAPNERERASGARSLAYARTPFAFAVHPSVRLRDIALVDVARIFSGEVTTWPDGTTIRPIRRPHNDGVTLTLAAVSPAMRHAMDLLQQRPGIPTAGNDQDSAEALESVRGSFGAITLAQHRTERRRLVLLSLDGVAPAVEAMVAERYPIATMLHAVIGRDPPAGVRAFLEFITSAEGHTLLLASGHEPLPAGAFT